MRPGSGLGASYCDEADLELFELQPTTVTETYRVTGNVPEMCKFSYCEPELYVPILEVLSVILQENFLISDLRDVGGIPIILNAIRSEAFVSKEAGANNEPGGGSGGYAYEWSAAVWDGGGD